MAYLLSIITDPTAWIALATLTAMEIVLGIDNLIFISVLTNKLPQHQRSTARRIGISAALILRLLLLATIAIVVKLTIPVFHLFDISFTWRDLIFIFGGLFLVWKATNEIHQNVDPNPAPAIFNRTLSSVSISTVIGQILFRGGEAGERPNQRTKHQRTSNQSVKQIDLLLT